MGNWPPAGSNPTARKTAGQEQPVSPLLPRGRGPGPLPVWDPGPGSALGPVGSLPLPPPGERSVADVPSRGGEEREALSSPRPVPAGRAPATSPRAGRRNWGRGRGRAARDAAARAARRLARPRQTADGRPPGPLLPRHNGPGRWGSQCGRARAPAAGPRGAGRARAPPLAPRVLGPRPADRYSAACGAPRRAWAPGLLLFAAPGRIRGPGLRRPARGGLLPRPPRGAPGQRVCAPPALAVPWLPRRPSAPLALRPRRGPASRPRPARTHLSAPCPASSPAGRAPHTAACCAPPPSFPVDVIAPGPGAGEVGAPGGRAGGRRQGGAASARVRPSVGWAGSAAPGGPRSLRDPAPPPRRCPPRLRPLSYGRRALPPPLREDRAGGGTRLPPPPPSPPPRPAPRAPRPLRTPVRPSAAAQPSRAEPSRARTSAARRSGGREWLPSRPIRGADQSAASPAGPASAPSARPRPALPGAGPREASPRPRPGGELRMPGGPPLKRIPGSGRRQALGWTVCDPGSRRRPCWARPPGWKGVTGPSAPPSRGLRRCVARGPAVTLRARRQCPGHCAPPLRFPGYTTPPAPVCLEPAIRSQRNRCKQKPTHRNAEEPRSPQPGKGPRGSEGPAYTDRTPV
ncbi:PREDICTED: basic proline-rich protein-like [Capra hircus]|uniref:basic proline-rich protein-like n=1 Tax=Capra hircus TaxID=9925 RepID=UPI000846CA14|nr:PREDICTED: basic proline-rich protein-like [Capra hircus]